MRPERPRAPHSDADFRSAALAQLEPLHRFALSLTRNRVSAEELVQEAFVQALRFQHTFDRSLKEIRPWLFKILNNAHRRHFRRQPAGLSLDDLERLSVDTGDVYAELFQPNSRLEELNWDQVDDRVKNAIDVLPEPLRRVFLLFAVEDLKYREVAEVENIPIGTVMSRLARARKLLISSLAVSPQYPSK